MSSETGGGRPSRVQAYRLRHWPLRRPRRRPLPPTPPPPPLLRRQLPLHPRRSGT